MAALAVTCVVLGLAVAVLCIIGLLVNERFFQKYEPQINQPWQDAIAAYDWELTTKYERLADIYLEDLKTILNNPLRWRELWFKVYSVDQLEGAESDNV